jgi:hypothetical protein
MRANGGQIDEDRLDSGNVSVHTLNDGVDALTQYCVRKRRLSKTIDV